MREVPYIDRGIHDGGRRRKRSRSPAARLLAFVIVALLVASVLAIAWECVNGGNHASGVSYTAHTPISISGNSQFTSANGVVRGNGTAGNPYVIENWSIDATGYSSAISIFGTSAYFIIRNCSLSNANGDIISITGVSVSNGQIINNICAGGGIDGIYLSNCHNFLIYNNSCVDNTNWGIRIRNTDGITIFGNYCENNGVSGSDAGMFFDGSDRNAIKANMLYDNNIGIMFSASSRNNVSYNNCSMNTGLG